MYDPIWSNVPPYEQAVALVAAAKDEDILIKEKLLVDIAHGLGLRVVLDPDDSDFSMELLLDALADVGGYE